jgi:hypothetical protein
LPGFALGFALCKYQVLAISPAHHPTGRGAVLTNGPAGAVKAGAGIVNGVLGHG